MTVEATGSTGDAPGTARTGGSAESTLTQRTIHAGRWRSASLLMQAILQFGLGVVLARLLPPEDFGLAALALVVVGFVGGLAEHGLSAAVVHRRPLTERHVRVSFTLSMLIGFGLAAGLFALAPYAGVLLRNDSLPTVLRAESLLFIFTFLGTTARALLRRALEFRRLFVIEVGSYVAGYALVAVTLALLGFGVWSLVFGVVVQEGLACSLALAMSRHPLRPLLAAEERRQLWSYGGAATLNAVVSYAARNAQSVVIGRWLGASALGLFTRAWTVFATPIAYLGNTIFGVLFPVMSEIQTDRARLRKGCFLAVQLSVLVVAPLCAGIVVAAPHLIVGLYGRGWGGATLPLQILASVGVFRAVYNAAASVTYASGNILAEVRRQAVYTALVVVGGVIGASWGITGVSVGVAAAMVFMYFAMAQLSLRIVEGSWRGFFAVHLPGLLLGAEILIVASAVRWTLERAGVGNLGILSAVIGACAAAYPVGIYLLPARLRPADLFSRFTGSLAALPTPVHRVLAGVLRVEG